MWWLLCVALLLHFPDPDFEFRISCLELSSQLGIFMVRSDQPIRLDHRVAECPSLVSAMEWQLCQFTIGPGFPRGVFASR